MKKKDNAYRLRTTANFLAEMKRINEGPWFKRVWYYRVSYLKAPWRRVWQMRDDLRVFWQRGRRGWAISDTWHGDVYLARIIAEMCAYLKEYNYTTPYPFYEDEKHGHAQWETYLGEMAQAFGDYVAFMSDDDGTDEWQLDIGNVRYKALIERMRPLLDHWSSLND